MGYAMAKVAVLLCMSLLLVAHVDAARALREASDTMIAQTFATAETLPPPVEETAEFEAIPTPGSAEEYNYNTETTTDATTTEEFASEGFLVPPPPEDGTDPITEEFASDAFVQDQDSTEQTTMFAEEGAVPEGTLWKDVDATTTESFADETTGGFLVDPQGSGDSQPYVFDATSRDADAVFPQEGSSLADTSVFDFQETQDTTEQQPEFEFDENKDEFGN